LLASPFRDGLGRTKLAAGDESDQRGDTVHVDTLSSVVLAFCRRHRRGGIEIHTEATFRDISALPESAALKGEQPTVDLMIGYRKGNASPILKAFLSRIGGLIDRAPRSEAK
jgi:hypothetical protein